jgi:hypothetical protein
MEIGHDSRKTVQSEYGYESGKLQEFSVYEKAACENKNWSHNEMTGIQFVTDEKGRRVAVQIDLRKHGAVWQDFWDGLVAESRRKEKTDSYENYRAKRLKRHSSRG